MTKQSLINSASHTDRTLPDHVHVLNVLSIAEVPANDAEVSISWNMILPAGEKIDARDGRAYLNPDPQALVDQYNADPVEIMVDTNHDSVYSNWDPEAHGWVKELDLREGAIWGRIEWTDHGQDVLAKKHYRYLSPAFMTDAQNTILGFVSVGLVNQPAMTMPAVARSETSGNSQNLKTKSKESIVDETQLAQMRTLYGLADDASVEDILAAAGEATAKPAAETDAEAKAAAAAEAEAAAAGTGGGPEGAAAAATGDTPDLTDYVPRADYDAAVEKLAGFETAEEAAPTEAEVSEAVDAAIATARIAPASRAHYVSMCSTVKGFTAFKDFAKTGPKVVATAADASLNTPATAGAQLSAAEITVCRSMNIDQAKFLANKKSKGA